VKEPNIPPCAIGEPADFRGLKFYAIYDDGTKQEIDVVLRMFHELNLQEIGTERMGQVIYEGKRLSVRIPLKEKTLTSIHAVPDMQMRCYEGRLLDRSQVTVTAFYSDGSNRVVDNYKVSPHQALSPSDNKITFRYGRCVSEMPIVVQPLPAPRTPPDMLPGSMSSLPDNIPAPSEQPSGIPDVPPTKTVVAISVARKPNRQKYLVGDTMVDLKGGRLDIIYSDGSVGQIDMVANGPVYIDSKKAGIGSISFSCLGKQLSFPIDVLEPRIVKLTVAKQPTKQDYEEGEELDLAGLVLEAAYNDGSVRAVRGLQSNGLVVGMGHADEGVTLSYENEPFTIHVNVKKRETPVTVLSVTLAREPNKIKYIENDPQGLDLTGAELSVQMSDGRRLTVPVTPDMADPVDLSRPGRCLLNIRYMGHPVVCSVYVDAKALRELRLVSPMLKTEYIEGEKIDIRGLAVEACYDNGDCLPVRSCLVTPERASVKDKEVCVCYEGKKLTIPIAVRPLEVTLLDWARQPVKTVYYTQEQDFLCDGGVLRVRRNNDTEEEIPLTRSMVSGFHTDRVGPRLLSVTYEGKTIPLSITVKERVLLGLRIVKKPRTEYFEGEPFDPAGLVVEALYTGETSEVVSVNYLPYGPLTQGTTSVMLVYQDKAVVLSISVAAAKVSEPCPDGLRPSFDAMPASVPAAAAEPDSAPAAESICEEDPFAPGMKEEGWNSPEDNPERVLSEKTGDSPDACCPEEAGNDTDSTIITPRQKRKWTSVPAFYPSTFCMRFSEDYAF